MLIHTPKPEPQPSSWFRKAVATGSLMALLATDLTSIAPIHAQEGLRVMRSAGAQYVIVSPQHLLKDTFVSDVAACRGWGAWAIIHQGQARPKVLVQGVIERGGSQAIPAAADAEKLTGVPLGGQGGREWHSASHSLEV